MYKARWCAKYGLTEEKVKTAFASTANYGEAAKAMGLRFPYQAMRAKREFSIGKILSPGWGKKQKTLPAEFHSKRLLERNGFTAELTPYISPYDILCDGRVRIEVKEASIGEDGAWLFNIHRHGKVNETEVDAYLLRLRPIPPFGKNHITLVIPAPIGRGTLSITPRCLISKYKQYINAFDHLRNGHHVAEHTASPSGGNGDGGSRA